jgi:hypothetical protein
VDSQRGSPTLAKAEALRFEALPLRNAEASFLARVGPGLLSIQPRADTRDRSL